MNKSKRLQSNYDKMTKGELAKMLKIADLNNICRTCLRERVYLRDIHQSRLPKMIEACTDIRISANDGLPSKICSLCFRMVAKMFLFKKKAERNDRLLKQYVESNFFSKKHRRDIIEKALNEADIQSEFDMSTEIEEIIIHTVDEDLDEVPLNERLQMLSENEKVSSKVQFFNSDSNSSNFDIENVECVSTTIDSSNSVITESANTQTFVTLHSNFDNATFFNENHKNLTFEDPLKISESVLNSHIFAVSPPPLIPLEPNKSIETNNESCDSKDNSSEPFNNLPPAPPLVPIVENLVLTCSKCGLEFKTIDGLKEHKMNSCYSKALQCNICHKVFKESIKLIKHLKGHMVSKDYGCKLCGKRYPNPSTFQVHMRTHTGERPFKCPQCGKGFTRWAGVVYHMRSHESNKPYACDKCDKRFKISSNLARHKLLHGVVMPFCCSFCGKTFGQANNYKLHIRTYHTNERPFLCNECGKSFVNSTRLKRHMWCHSGYKPHRCQTCDKGYSNSTDLKKHEKTMHDVEREDKRYECDKCGLRFMTYLLLRRHNVEHKKPFACDVCPKRFTKRSYWKLHQRRCHALDVVEEDLNEATVSACQ